ncbi:MAG: terminase large subunit [Roseburia sp.]|nr:terminase large subunit [Roseburia sp.]MDY5884255.1 terminase large subunit [Roseburia sp.]
MVTVKEIDAYLEYVKKHPNWINKKRKLLIKNIVKPLLKRNDVFFDEKTFRNCIAYCEKNFYPLFPYQKFIYAFVFMYDKLGLPIFPKIIIMMGRGNGKDGFMVPLANFLQTPLYGVDDYNVELVANSEAQIKDTFKVAYNVCVREKFKGKFRCTKEEIENLATHSVMRYNTSNAGTKDGKRPGCIFFNELHAYEDYEQINVFESALGKIKHAREFIITTNGYVRDGPLDEILTACNQILESGENPLGYFPFLCEIDSENEVDVPEAWHKANPSMEYLPILAHQIEVDYHEMKMISSKRPEFLTKRMNLPSRLEEQTVTSWNNILRCCYDDIEKKTPREVPDTRNQNAIIGIDYADVRDFASAGVLTKSDEDYIWMQHTWICADSPFINSIKFPIANQGMEEFSDFEIVPGPVIDVNIIIDWCMRKMADYTVKKIAMDTYRYLLFKTGFLERGISIESKDEPDGIVRLVRKITSATGIIAPFIQKAFAEGHVIYGPSAIMRWYTNNTSVIEDKFGNKTFGKIEPKLRKNDGFMAFDVAMFCNDLLNETVIYI